MTSLVTGGAGFLGSHLVDYLLARGHRVIAIDNLITGSARNIAHLAGHPRFTFIKQDVTEYLYVDPPIDYVWHLASPASPVDYLQHPIQTLKVGSLGTHKTLGLAKTKRARYLLASTSEIYGDPLVHPQPETYWGNVNTIGPRGCYDEAKRFAEALTVAYAHQHHIDARIARIFNTYGPRMRLADGRVVPAFLTQALENRPITIFGDGSQTRSFSYYTDTIDALYRLMTFNPRALNTSRRTSKDYPLVFNIGNPAETTILEFARQIIAACASRSKITFKPLPHDDPKQRRPDITRARQYLKWRPRVPLARGLRLTIQYFRSHLP